MALSRPTRFFPDKASGEYRAIDGTIGISASAIPTNDNTILKMIGTTSPSPAQYISTPFTFVVNGDSPIYGVKLSIYDMNNTIIYVSNTIYPSSTLYPLNYQGKENIIKMYVPLTTSGGYKILTNSATSNYKWTVEVFWIEGGSAKSLVSAEVFFESRGQLNLTELYIDDITYLWSEESMSISGLYHKFRTSYTPSYIPISYFNWKIYNAYNVLIYDTGRIYSPDIAFEYGGFLPQLNYTLELTIVNIANNSTTKSVTLSDDGTTNSLPMDTQLSISNDYREGWIRIAWDKQAIIDELTAKVTGFNVSQLSYFSLFRRKRGDLYYQHIFDHSLDAYEEYDYMGVNNGEYAYYLYPINYNATTGAKKVIGGFFSTYEDNKNITYHKANFWGWHLLVLSPNENQRDGIYRVFKHYIWDMGLESTPFKNNVNISVNGNFTQFPKVQKGKSNYISLTLQSLAGYINCDTNVPQIIDTQEVIDDIRALPSTNYEMILKNSKGAIWKVTPTSEVSFSMNEKLTELLTNMSLEFTEVGNIYNISVVNKVANPKWMFTVTGYQPIGTLSTNMAGYTLDAGTILAPSSVTIE